MLGDILTGFLRAWYEGNISSHALRRGLFHKVGFLAVIVLSQGLEYAADIIPQIQLEMPLTVAVCAYIILTEVVSIIENIKGITPEIDGIVDRLTPHITTSEQAGRETGDTPKDIHEKNSPEDDI